MRNQLAKGNNKTANELMLAMTQKLASKKRHHIPSCTRSISPVRALKDWQQYSDSCYLNSPIVMPVLNLSNFPDDINIDSV